MFPTTAATDEVTIITEEKPETVVTVTEGPGPAGAAGRSVTAITSEYASSSGGTEIPQEGWSPFIPSVLEGHFLWTRLHITLSDGTSTDSYTVAHQGISGTGLVNSVNGIMPDANGNITLYQVDTNILVFA